MKCLTVKTIIDGRFVELVVPCLVNFKHRNLNANDRTNTCASRTIGEVDCSIVRFDDPLNNGQAETSSTCGASATGVATGKSFGRSGE